MPIDLYGSLKKSSQWAFGSPLLNSILSSSIFVAGVIALIMVLLITVMYPAKKGTPFSIVAKMFVYMFFGTLLVIFLHDSVLKFMLEEERAAVESESFMKNTTIEDRDPVYGSLYTPIKPGTQSKPEAPPAVPAEDNTLPVIKPPRTGGNPYA